jgi:UDP-2-acetamido-3-amino-2,3-dideoxy-glucuronate N-acetyltransferase
MAEEQQQPPRVAVVGMGAWGKNLVRNFNQLGALSCVCDASPSARSLCAQDYPDVRFTDDYRFVLADPGIDAVALATPAVTHSAMATAALEAGKDVYVEKPLAVDVGEGEAVATLATRSGRILMVGHILRYHPAVIRLQQLIGDGALGKIQYVYSNRLNIGKIRTEENILWSFAPHDISVILALLGESPVRVTAQGGAYLSSGLYDVTLTQFEFASGVQAHIFVSWLHPVKEQRLVVVGSSQMAVFDDSAEHKLMLYPHKVEWKNRVPTAVKAESQVVDIDRAEPLRRECQHFLDCVTRRVQPVTDGAEGLAVLRVLDACQRALLSSAAVSLILPPVQARGDATQNYYVHDSAFVDEGAEIGSGTKIWHFSHIMKGARIGKQCIIGQNVNVAGASVVGDNVKIQNNVSIYSGVVVEDDVFLGPSCVLTNVTNPRSQVNRHSLYEPTVLRKGATIGANPARQAGWMSRHGHRLGEPDAHGIMRCPESGYRYQARCDGTLGCLDLDEEQPLPAELNTGTKAYRAFRVEAVAR